MSKKKVEEVKVEEADVIRTVEITEDLFVGLYNYIAKQKAADVCYLMVDLDKVQKLRVK